LEQGIFSNRSLVRAPWGPAALLLSILLPSTAYAAQGYAAIGITSDYVHHGLTQSSGEPAVQAGAGLRSVTGLYASAWLSSIDIERQGPDFGDGSGIELNLIGGYERPLSATWSAEINAGRYIYFAEHRMLDYNYWEFWASLSWRERLRLSLAYSPEATDHTRRAEPEALDGERTVVELSAEWPLRRWLALGGGFGYHDAREVSDVEFTFWSAGATLRWRRYALSLTHFSTDADARARWPDARAADRFAATLVLSFG
jgi:uncharacterized protein (TIGR02001 family)